MANITFAQSIGSAILLDGNAYEYVGTSTGSPTNSTDDPSNINISGLSYDNADAQGKDTYTAGERALAYYEFGTRGGFTPNQNKQLQCSSSDPTSSNDGTQGYGTNNSLWINFSNGKIWKCTDSTASNAVWVWQNTDGTLVPMDYGVIRYWGNTTGFINGVGLGYINDDEDASKVGNMVSGDYFQATLGGTAVSLAFSFLPMTNP